MTAAYGDLPLTLNMSQDAFNFFVANVTKTSEGLSRSKKEAKILLPSSWLE
jgi:hypothetical protein